MVAYSGDHMSSSITEKNPSQLNSFSVQLADETWLHVFSHLSQEDLCQVALVSTRFKRLALDPSLWQKEILQLFASKMKSNLNVILKEQISVGIAVLLQITIILFYVPPRYFKATDNAKKQTKCLPT